MNRWEKILFDTGEQARLNDGQRFWRALALLRSGEVLQAQACIVQGPMTFQAQTRTRILLAEVLARRQLQKEAEEILLSCWSSAHASEKLKLGWALAARVIRQPSEKMSALIIRMSEALPADDPAQPTSEEQWRLWLSLEKNSGEFQQHFKRLEWLKSGACPQEDLRAAACQIMEYCNMGAGPWRRLLQAFMEDGDWEFILAQLFEPCIKASTQKRLLWERLHQSCPREWRAELMACMRRYASRQPLQELEEFIAQYGGGHEKI